MEDDKSKLIINTKVKEDDKHKLDEDAIVDKCVDRVIEALTSLQFR
ncbi:hypothetical protein [uncultured Shewanella sp.]|nr:hypothetical protein [uncultured Shewanella sp.]